MSDVLAALTAKLEAEVEKQIAAVQAAADEWVQSFRDHAYELLDRKAEAEKPAKRERAPNKLKGTELEIAQQLAARESQEGSPPVPSEADDHVTPGFQITDHSAAASNMSVAHKL